MDPVTGAFIVLGGLQIANGLAQAESIYAQSQLNARIGDLNAKYAEMDAWEAEKYGYTQSARYQTLIDQTLSDQRVILADQNIDISSGTAQEIQEETRLTGFLNTLDIQSAARQRAKGYKIEASNLRLGAQMTRSQGAMDASATQTAAILQGIGTGLSGYAKTKG